MFAIATPTIEPTRRQFLKTGAAAGAGLVIGLLLPVRGARAAADSAASGAPFDPNAFIRIAADDTATVLIKHIEFGQGTYTGLATVVAEELDADWSQIRAEGAPANAKLYNNLHWGPVQGTGGSSSIANSYEQMRRAGAAARAMLAGAAADAWGVPAKDITVKKGVITHAASGRSARFGEFAEAAASRAVPAEIPLKDPKAFSLIGHDVPRLDSPAKARGQATYTIDVTLPGMLTAVIARPPVFGATVRSFDATAAKAVKGVTDIVQVPQGIAVLANGFWPAKTGSEALTIDWDLTTAETRSSDALMAEYRQLAEKPGLDVRVEGDAGAAIEGAAKVLEASFDYPFLAHAPMEPLDCVVRLGTDSCEVWTGSQLPTVDQGAAAAIAGLKPEQVQVHTMLTGGSFGRRATPTADMVSEAVAIAKGIGGRAPIRLIWTREDDIRGGYYRPMYHHRMRAGLDAKGNLVGWQHRIVGQSILRNTPFADAFIKNGIDGTSVEGASNLPYAIGNIAIDLHTTDVGVPVLWWRSVGSTHTAYSLETFIDELAEATGRDPVEFRLSMLGSHPRHAAVLRLAAEKAGWGKPMPAGRGRGIALAESFNSYVAQVADVSVDSSGQVKVERVVCAVDCGLVVNPDVVRAQMEGGIGYGLGAILHDAITLDEGRVEQSNFHDYVPLRIDEMPAVEVHIVPSAAPPTGVGEPGTPPIGPAVANAVHAATGKRIRSLPFATHGLTTA